jgi:polyisoprenyl-teichoic acid--peptidoglycan teichoic acid transferase
MIDFKKKMEEQEKIEAKENGQTEVLDVAVNNKRKKLTTYIIAIVVIGLVFSGKVIMSSQSTSDWLSKTGFFNKLTHLVPSNDKLLKGEEADRINILLLGMGGEGHDGAYLADTIMLASLKPSTKQVSLISIPRDMQVPLEEAGWRKINNINAFAEMKEPGSGGQKTIEALTKLFEINIDYYVRVDFAGFMNIIDELGGVEVNVENTLDDYAYPILGQEDNPNYYARYEHLHIDKGLQKMNGSLALKYARSRHGVGLEGSDFARAKRQQLLLAAVKDRLLSKQTLLNPVMIGKLINEFSKHVSTNLDVWEILKIWELFKDIDKNNIISKVLSDAPDGLLVSTVSSEGAYILVPVIGNFTKINNLIRDVFTDGQPLVIEEIENIKKDASVSIKNGTWITGLAGEKAITLEALGFSIAETGNAPVRDYIDTIVFDLTYGKNNEALNTIKKATQATQSFDFPEWVKEYQNQTDAADFLLILGTDSNNAN